MQNGTRKAIKSATTVESANLTPTSTTTSDRPAQPLRWTVVLSATRLLALALLAVSPWYYGSVTWTAQLACHGVVFVLLVVAMAYAATFRLAVTNLLIYSLCGLVALAWLQTAPLPQSVWGLVATGAAFEAQVDQVAEPWITDLPEVRPPASEPTDLAAMRAPQTLSIHPTQTRASTATLASAVAMLVSCSILFRPAAWRIGLLGVLAVTTLSNALLGILQSVAWNHWTLLAMPTETYFSTFVSRNSAPQFYFLGIAASIGLLTWWTQVRASSDHNQHYHIRYPAVNPFARLRRRLDELLTDMDLYSAIGLLTITFLILAIITTASRGGILACICAAAVVITVSSTKNSDVFKIGVCLSICVMLAVVMLNSLGIGSLPLERLNSLSQEAHQLSNSRLMLWKLAIYHANWFVGCGLGTFHFAILPTMENGTGKWFYHAESIPVELLFELGLGGLMLASSGLWWLLKRLLADSRKSKDQPLFLLPVLFVTIAIGLQSLVDFSLIIPAIFLPLATVIGGYLAEYASLEARAADKQMNVARMRRRKRRAHSRSTTPSSHARPTHRRTAILLGIFISLGMAQGIPSLIGFAQAESIGELTLDEQARVVARHPELHLEVGRSLQKLASDTFENTLRHQAAGSEDQLQRLAQAEMVAAACRGGSTGKLAALLDSIAADAPGLIAMESSAAHMSQAIRACTLDWRACWGLYRGDTGSLTKSQRARNYARLWLLTRIDPRRQQAIGMTAVLAGERQIGLNYWKYSLKMNPQDVVQAIPLVEAGISPQEMLDILPVSNTALRDFAKSLAEVKSPAGQETDIEAHLESVLSMIDTKDLLDQAVTYRDWELLSWVASRVGDARTQVLALRQVVRKSKSNHQARYQLAMLIRDDDVAEARDLLQEAIAGDAGNQQYSHALATLTAAQQPAAKQDDPN